MLTFERVRVALEGFSLTADFSADTRDRVALIGPSGAGKSTLLNVLGGFLKPAAGRLLWEGRDLTDTAPGERPFSMLFQDGNLFPHLTAAENAGLGLRPSLRLSDTERGQVSAVLKRVGLEGLEGRKPGALSGGQQGRVALARVLLSARPFVLLDEPFAALGPAMKGEMLALLKEVLDETGAGLMMVTHDPDDALRIAGKTVLVADGVAAEPQETKALFEAPPPALAAYLGRSG